MQTEWRARLRWGAAAFLWICTAYCSSVLADEPTDRRIAESALREARDILSRELFGHYDVADLEVLKVETFRDRMFEPGNAMCQGWLYLHCGVATGHVFDGSLSVLLAVDRDGSWRAVSPHWRSRREYSLQGYLLLEGRQKQGYVVFPKGRAR